MCRDDINVIVDRSEVTICALKPHTRKEARDGHLLRERHFGRFFRRLRLPYLYHLPTIRYIAIRVKNPWLIMVSAGSTLQASKRTSRTACCTCICLSSQGQPPLSPFKRRPDPERGSRNRNFSHISGNRQVAER
jgi:hypothetical protein